MSKLNRATHRLALIISPIQKELLCQFMNMPVKTAVTSLRHLFVQAQSLNALAVIPKNLTNCCLSLERQRQCLPLCQCPRVPAEVVRTRVVRVGVLLLEVATVSLEKLAGEGTCIQCAQQVAPWRSRLLEGSTSCCLTSKRDAGACIFFPATDPKPTAKFPDSGHSNHLTR